MDESLPDGIGYTIGLIAGEGSFFVMFTRDDRYRHGVWCGPKFSMTMGEHTQKMLQHQRDLYDLGTVNESQKGYAWVLSSREDCHTLIDYIDRYVEWSDTSGFTQSPKFAAYQSWRKALNILQPGKRLSKSEVLELAELRKDINYLAAPTRLPSEEIQEIVEATHAK